MSLFYLFPTRKNISPIKLWYMKPNIILSTLIYIDYYIYKVYTPPAYTLIKNIEEQYKTHKIPLIWHQTTSEIRRQKQKTINDNLWFRGKTTNYVWMVFPIIFQIKHHIKKKKPLTKNPPLFVIIKNVLHQECDNSFKLVTLMKYFQHLSDGE